MAIESTANTLLEIKIVVPCVETKSAPEAITYTKNTIANRC